MKCYSCKDCTDTGVEMDCTVPNDSCAKITIDGSKFSQWKYKQGYMGFQHI